MIASLPSIPFNFISTAAIAIGFALIHLFSGKLRFVKFPRSRWLSGAGGVSVAYVFVHILPELSEHQAVLEEAEKGFVAYLENHVYLLALLGLTIFYGLERMASESRESQDKAGKGNVTSQGVFWVHIASFAVYNALIGYLLMHREDKGLLRVMPMSSEEDGMLAITLDEKTEFDNNQGVLRIQEDGQVFLN